MHRHEVREVAFGWRFRGGLGFGRVVAARADVGVLDEFCVCVNGWCFEEYVDGELDFVGFFYYCEEMYGDE